MTAFVAHELDDELKVVRTVRVASHRLPRVGELIALPDKDGLSVELNPSTVLYQVSDVAHPTKLSSKEGVGIYSPHVWVIEYTTVRGMYEPRPESKT